MKNVFFEMLPSEGPTCPPGGIVALVCDINRRPQSFADFGSRLSRTFAGSDPSLRRGTDARRQRSLRRTTEKLGGTVRRTMPARTGRLVRGSVVTSCPRPYKESEEVLKDLLPKIFYTITNAFKLSC